MFETFDVPALYVANTAVLSILASGRTTGTSLCSGHGVTMSVPVYEGHSLPYTIVKGSLIAGRNITDSMMSLLSERGYSFRTTTDREIVRNIKEQLSYIAEDYDQELLQSQNPSNIEPCYALPNGDTITLGSERFRCAEAMFRPRLIGIEMPGIHETVYCSIRRSNKDIRRELFDNIILSGGNTLFPGMATRLRTELTKLVTETVPGLEDALPGVHALKEEHRQHVAWLGGSLLSSMSSFDQMCMTKEEYDEFGPALVHLKCFWSTVK